MLSLFRRKKTIETNAVQDGIAQSIVAKCHQVQQRWADAMQRRSERLSVNSKRVILTLYCLAASSLSIYLIVAGVTGHRLTSLYVSRIQLPAHSIHTVGWNTCVEPEITKQEYERIAGYDRYIDSLARSPTSKATYDSILSSHPGLLDSLALIENFYLSQLKN